MTALSVNSQLLDRFKMLNIQQNVTQFSTTASVSSENLAKTKSMLIKAKKKFYLFVALVDTPLSPSISSIGKLVGLKVCCTRFYQLFLISIGCSICFFRGCFASYQVL
jgi:hypothetical protein